MSALWEAFLVGLGMAFIFLGVVGIIIAIWS